MDIPTTIGNPSHDGRNPQAGIRTESGEQHKRYYLRYVGLP